MVASHNLEPEARCHCGHGLDVHSLRLDPASDPAEPRWTQPACDACHDLGLVWQHDFKLLPPDVQLVVALREKDAKAGEPR